MSTSPRFNRNDASVPNDRLFPADFITDQNAQDEDLLQLAKDFGCLPCMGYGLGVTVHSHELNQVKVAAGWGYDTLGRRCTVPEDQIIELEDTVGGNNYLILTYLADLDTPRPAHKTGTSYDTRLHDSFEILVQSSYLATDIVLANCTKSGGVITINLSCRTIQTCRLVAQSMIGGLGEAPASPGTHEQLPDLIKLRNIPMPIIAKVETLPPEDFGVTGGAIEYAPRLRVGEKIGTPIADVKVWIGDWMEGHRNSENHKRIDLTLPGQMGMGSYTGNMWVTMPPGYYYIILKDESWFSKGTSNGSTYIDVEDDFPDDGTFTFYIAPYAPRYVGKATPMKETEGPYAYGHLYSWVPDPPEEGSAVQPWFPSQKIGRESNETLAKSPVEPWVIFEGLSIGSRYRLEVASVISEGITTKFATVDFVVGSDLRLATCWDPAADNITAKAVHGGVEIEIPDVEQGGQVPAGYEAVFTYSDESGEDPSEPDFNNSAHPTIYTTERKVKLDIPPGRKVKVKVRAIHKRMAMRVCAVGDYSTQILIPAAEYTTAGGATTLINDKQINQTIIDKTIGDGENQKVGIFPLTTPIGCKRLHIANMGTASLTNFRIWAYETTGNFDSGENIQIGGQGGDKAALAAGEDCGKAITIEIRDRMAITIENFGATDTTFEEFQINVIYSEK